MIQILTLCPRCAESLGHFYRMNKLAIETTTEKKKQCEQCRQKLPEDILAQYTLASRRREPWET